MVCAVTSTPGGSKIVATGGFFGGNLAETGGELKRSGKGEGGGLMGFKGLALGGEGGKRYPGGNGGWGGGDGGDGDGLKLGGYEGGVGGKGGGKG